MSFDMSTMSGVSAVSIAEDQLSKLRKEYDLLQQRLRQVEDERDLLESTSIISDVETGYEVKLSDSLIKLVGELRQEKNKNKEVRKWPSYSPLSEMTDFPSVINYPCFLRLHDISFFFFSNAVNSTVPLL